MPVVCRRMRSYASRVKARMPQWESETRVRKSSRSMPERIGLPIQRCDQGIAPGRMFPLRREPITMSTPFSLSAPMNSGMARKS